MALAYLFEPTTQFQARTGANLTAGFLRVFYTQTDDPAPTYSDFAATPNEEDIVLDADGRAVVIVDDEKTYRLEVYNRNHGLLFTIDPLSAIGGAGGAGQVVTVESTDGSVDVMKTVIGSNTYFDLSTKINPDEPLDWIKASISSIPEGTVVPAYDEGTMFTTADGVLVTAGRFYHTTTWLHAIPAGDGINYETVSVKMRLNGNALWTRTFDIDNSLSDAVDLEVSYDLDCGEDGYVDYEVTGISNLASVDLGVQFHRIFNGYSSEYAKKTWVENNFVQGNALGVDDNTITGISGIPIVGIASSTVSAIASAIASSYSESAVSSKVDQSAFDNCCSAMSGYISAIQQDTADISAAVSAVTSQTGNYIPWSASGEFQPSGNYVSGDEFSAYTATALTGIQQDTGAISAAVSAVTGLTGNYIDWSASGTFQPSGNYVSGEDFSAYTASALTGIQQDTANISAAVSGLTGTYIQYADLEGSGSVITGISGSAIGGAGGKTYTGVWPIVVDNTADTISAANKTLAVDDTMTGYASGDSAVIGVNTSTVLSGLSAYQLTADMSGYQPSGDYAYNSSLSDYQLTAGMTAYQPSGDYAYNSAVSSKADQSSLADYQPASAMTAYQLSGDYAYNSAVSGKQDSSAMTAYQEITGMTAYQPAGDYQPSGDYIYVSALGWAEV